MQLEDSKCWNKPSCCSRVIAGAVSVLLQASVLLLSAYIKEKKLKVKAYFVFSSLTLIY